MLEQLLDSFSDFVTRRRALVLAGVALVFVGFILQFPKLEADFSPQDLHTTFEEQKAILDDFSDVFGNTENVLLVLVQAEEIAQRDVLQYIHTVSLHLEAEPFTDRVDGLTIRSFTRTVGENVLEVSPIVQGETVESEEVESLIAAVEETPLVQSRLISRSGRLAAIALYLAPGFDKVEQVQPIVDSISEYLESNPPPDGARVVLGGLPHIRTWVAQRFKEDQVLLIPLSLMVCLFILFISFRWIPGVLIPGLAVIVSASMVLGAMAAYGEPINIINQVVPLLIIVIGISDSIHLVNRFREEFSKRGDAVLASKHTLKRMAVACFLTSLTTAVGFASLGVSRTELVRRFGVTAAIGVGLAYLITIHLLPALLSWTHPKVEVSSKRASHGWLEDALESLMKIVLARPRTVLLVSSVVFAAAVYVASLVNVDSHLMETFREGDEVWVTTTLIQDELDGVLPLEVSLRSERHGRFNEPDVLNAMHELRLWATEQPGVLSAVSYADFLHQARVTYRDDPELRDQPFSSVAEVNALASLLEGGNPSPIEPFTTLNRRRARLNIKVDDIGTRETRELGATINEKIDELFGELEEVDVILTGSAHVASAGITSLVDDMMASLLTAFVIIFGIMALLFRSVRMGLMSIPPNVVPLVLTMAYMTITGINLNTATVVTFAISLGLAVDHTIHMMARFGEEVTAGADIDAAVVASARGTGRAIVVTSVTLFAGMLVLFFSSFVPIRQFATLLAVTAVSCLFGNLIILPALLKSFYPKR